MTVVWIEFLQSILEGKLALGEGQMGSLTPVALDSIPEFQSNAYEGSRPSEFVPGYYFVNPQVTYRYHMDMGPKENVILDSFRYAYAREKQDPRFVWKGEAFKYFQNAMRALDEHHLVFVLTDRRLGQNSLDRLVKELHSVEEVSQYQVTAPQSATSVQVESKEEGSRKSSKKIIRPEIISMNDPLSRYYGPTREFQERKPERIERDAQIVQNSAHPKHLTLSPDPIEAKQGVQRGYA